MYYSLYQRKTLEYLFNKYKLGSKRKEQNDIKRLNLNGKIKNYKIICDNTIIQEYEFNELGFLVLEFNPKEYYMNEFYDNGLIKEKRVFDTNDKNLYTEYFHYNNLWILEEKIVGHHNNLQRNYDEYYEYDTRGNTTAIIRQYANYNDDVDTFKYNSKCQMTDHYIFDKSSRNFIGRFKYKFREFLTLEKYFSEDNKLLSSKKSTLDLHNNPIQVEKYMKFMNKKSTTNYLYSYDKYQNWVTRDQSVNGTKTVQETTQIEYFES